MASEKVIRVASIVTALVIVVGNMLTILTFFCNSHLRKRSFYLVINLAVADFLIGIIPATIFACITFNDGETNKGIYLVHISSDILLGLASMTTLALIAIERMWATVWPLRHLNSSCRVYVGAICASWLVPTLLTGLSISAKFNWSKIPVIWRKIAMHQPIAVIVILLMGTAAAYTITFVSFKRHTIQMEQAGSCSRVSRRKMQEQRLALTMCMVTGASILTWLPFVIMNYLYITINPSFFLASKILQYTNSAINPVFYAVKMPGFRKSLIKTVCFHHYCRKQKLVIPMKTRHNIQQH
ncbi:predicted protein [Nematostella vectensis]|uniref:G-protein coupled receptors family 1 profile domain-containing protein n=2 Tax=Nematostella vectensis TaxID=45351 RepID=A7RTI9_NEMVE|nr:predicted protein [Nematostella vectensis]|eukprot:XP_001637334.1 predicted protein [Nematostella vectensis]